MIFSLSKSKIKDFSEMIHIKKNRSVPFLIFDMYLLK